jgi:prephenate dehydratase
MNIAIQGIKGSFHHIAASDFFGEKVSLNECMSFAEIPELITKNVVEGAIMAIENSVAGAILPNYQLIDTHNLSICGEIYLPMIHNLMALKGQTMGDIKEIWSHPIALQHCQTFLRKYPDIRIVEEKDTATVAKMIEEKNLKGVAAIASKKAAEIYNLEILEAEIQTDFINMTRYFVLKKQRQHYPDDYLNNKASIKFITKHELGNLVEILAVFKKHHLSLSKIQSLPITKEPWKYAFFIDLIFDDYLQYCQALLAVENMVNELKILGEYQKNNPFVENNNVDKMTKV